MRLVRDSRAVRSAFTLVELLIVVAIIILLVTLSAAAILRFGRIGPVIATQNNMSKIHSALKTQWQAVRDQANRGTLPAGQSDRQAYINAQLVAAFPTTFAEAFAGYKAYTGYLNKYGITPATTGVTPQQQSAICLLMILQAGPHNTGLTQDTLGNTAVQNFQIGSQQVPGCVNGWSPPTPLIMSRGPQGITLTTSSPDGKVTLTAVPGSSDVTVQD